MNVEMKRQRVQGLGEFVLRIRCLGGHRKTTRDELCSLLLRTRKTNQTQALRSIDDERDQTQCFRFTTFVGVLRK
jgi:hypothetical protein